MWYVKPDMWQVVGGEHHTNLPRPQFQTDQTYCKAGECFLTWCAGLWPKAQGYHQKLKKTKITWSYGFKGGSRAAADFNFLRLEGLTFEEINTKCKNKTLCPRVHCSLLQNCSFKWFCLWFWWPAQALVIRYLPSLLIQFLCTVYTASCRMKTKCFWTVD